MSRSYTALAAADDDTTPPGWPEGWVYPPPPYPPGWSDPGITYSDRFDGTLTSSAVYGDTAFTRRWSSNGTDSGISISSNMIQGAIIGDLKSYGVALNLAHLEGDYLVEIAASATFPRVPTVMTLTAGHMQTVAYLDTGQTYPTLTASDRGSSSSTYPENSTYLGGVYRFQRSSGQNRVYHNGILMFTGDSPDWYSVTSFIVVGFFGRSDMGVTVSRVVVTQNGEEVYTTNY